MLPYGGSATRSGYTPVSLITSRTTSAVVQSPRTQYPPATFLQIGTLINLLVVVATACIGCILFQQVRIHHFFKTPTKTRVVLPTIRTAWTKKRLRHDAICLPNRDPRERV